MGVMIGAIVASQTAMRVAAMNAMKKNLENQKKAIDKQPQVCYTNNVERDNRKEGKQK
jgi:uncharacterized membrane-anchored protein YhcB (DUF1043 family)